jgi:hypothetical protein
MAFLNFYVRKLLCEEYNLSVFNQFQMKFILAPIAKQLGYASIDDFALNGGEAFTDVATVFRETVNGVLMPKYGIDPETNQVNTEHMLDEDIKDDIITGVINHSKVIKHLHADRSMAKAK